MAGTELGALRQELSSVDKTEQTELGQVGAALRQRHSQQHLANADLSLARIPGIGLRLKGRLAARGIRCAADVDYRIYQVPGIGPAKAAVLEEWRCDVEQEAAATAPPPSGSEMAAVKGKHEQRRQNLRNQIHVAESSATHDRHLLAQEFRRHRDRVDQQEAVARQKHDRAIAAAQREHDRQRANVTERFRQLVESSGAKRQQFREQLSELQQALSAKHFELCKIQRELNRYRGVSFPAYLAHVLRLWVWP